MPKGERIRFLRGMKQISQEEVARILHVKVQTIAKYEDDPAAVIPSDKLEQMAEFFGTTPNYILGWDSPALAADAYPIDVQRFPALTAADAAENTRSDESSMLYVQHGAAIAADFCLRMPDDAMTGARIRKGDLLFIRKQSAVEDGMITAAIVGDHLVVRRTYHDREHNLLWLHADNRRCPQILVSGQDLSHVRILGKAIAFQSDCEVYCFGKRR